MRRQSALLLAVLLLWSWVLTHVAHAQPRPQVFPLHSAEAGNVAGTVISTFGYPSVTVDNSIAAAWDGTLNYEGNFPSIGWIAVQCRNQATNLVVTTSTGAASVMCNITGAQQFRARVSGRTVGTVTATAAIMTGGESGLASVSITDTLVDNAPFTDGTSRVFPAGYIFDEVAGIALTENDVAASRIDSKRAQVFVIEDATTRGTRAGVTAAGLQVDSELPTAAALADGASAAPSTPTVGVVPLLMNATTVDRQRAVVNGLDSVGTGIAAAGLVGQLDDTATGAVTENQFAPVRISSRRALLIEGVASGTAVGVDTELPAAVALSDALGNPTAPLVGASLLSWNGASFGRVLDVAGAGDAPSTTSRVLATVGYGFDDSGATYKRIRTAGQDTVGTAGSLLATPGLFNGGTTVDRGRSASIANFPLATTLTARNSIGAGIGEKGSRWSVISNPAAGSQATASIAAEVGVRHVADCVSFSAAATTGPALTALTVNLRDGATGAGTVIWTYQVAITAGTGQQVAPHSACGLNLVGTTNTAMTLEFSASLANLIESVSVSGYNVN